MNKILFFVSVFCLVFVSNKLNAEIISGIEEKPAISSTKALSPSETAVVKEYLKEKILPSLIPAKNDYVDDNNRGSVVFNDAKGTNMLGREVYEESNYSRHKVVIPDGTTVYGINFAQKEPDTEAVFGKDVTFQDCNLVNVKIDPTWKIINSNTAQIKEFTEVKDGKTFKVIQVRNVKTGIFEEKKREEIIEDIASK